MAYQYLMKDGVINQPEDMQRLLMEIYVSILRIILVTK